MIAAVMQPYFFPYIGYFQLMQKADVFVFYDDVQYIDRGWVNRNKILVDDKPVWLTLPVRKASRALAINQRTYLLDVGVDQIKRKLKAAYQRAPMFDESFRILEGFLDFEEPNVAAFNSNLLQGMARRLGIRCEFKVASELDVPDEVHGERRILEICARLGVDGYVNASGGVNLYRPEHFQAAGIHLSFLHNDVSPTLEGSVPHHYSIIHDLMHQGFKGVQSSLNAQEIQTSHEFSRP